MGVAIVAFVAFVFFCLTHKSHKSGGERVRPAGAPRPSKGG